MVSIFYKTSYKNIQTDKETDEWTSLVYIVFWSHVSSTYLQFFVEFHIRRWLFWRDRYAL